MKLNRISIANWRNIESLDIALERVSIFRGANANGKTSVRDAIEYLLTGRCDPTTASGEGAFRLIRDGADKATIEADLQGQDVISVRCTLTEKSGRTPKLTHKTDPTYPVENVKAWLEKQKPVLSCLLNSRYFIKLDAGEQKKLLSAIILPESYEWPEQIKDKCNTVHIASLIPWDAAPFDVIEKAYEVAFAKRRDLNRDLKNLHVPEAIQPPAGCGDAEAVRTRLAETRQQVAQLESERRQGERARGEAESKKRVLEARIEGFEAAIRLEQRTLADIDAKLLSAKQMKDLQATAANSKQLAKIEQDIAAKRDELAGVEALLGQFDALARGSVSVEANNPDADPCKVCPTCRREVTAEWLTAAVAPHIERKNALLNDQNNLLRQQKELGDAEGAKRKIEEQKQLAADEARAKSILNEKNALLRTSRAELEGIIVPLQVIENQTELTGRETIRDLEGKLEEVAVADARAKEIIRAKDQQKKLTAAVLVLDSLVIYFGKDGVKGELLKEHIGGFTSAMNETLAGWGYAVGFEIEPYGFRVTNLTRHTTHDVQLLSGSEKLRFAVAFQVALAQVSGIRMVCIDEVDIFDAAGKSAFASLLMSADLDQIIALGTDEREEVPEVEGVAFYAMRDGKAVQLVAQEVA